MNRNGESKSPRSSSGVLRGFLDRPGSIEARDVLTVVAGGVKIFERLNPVGDMPTARFD